MKPKLVLFWMMFLILCIWCALGSASPKEEWSKTFGGSDDDFGNCVKQTSDGGYIVAGETSSYGAGYADVWLIRTDSEGNKKWWVTFGGDGADSALSVQETTDGGFIIAGGTESYGSDWFDVWLIKTDSEGNERWSKTFGGDGYDSSNSVQKTSDGGYIIAGETGSYGAGNSDVWLIKTDSRGNEEWNRTFGGSKDDWAGSVQQTYDDGFIIAGDTRSYGAGEYDVWLIKTDSKGNEEWNRTFGGSDYDSSNSVQETDEGGFIIVGGTRSNGAGLEDVWLIKTDSRGNIKWSKTFGGAGYDWGYSVQQNSDGGFIVAGKTSRRGDGNSDVWLIKTDSRGNKEWEATFGGTGADAGLSVQKTTDNRFIIAGMTTSYGAGNADLWLIKAQPE